MMPVLIVVQLNVPIVLVVAVSAAMIDGDIIATYP